MLDELPLETARVAVTPAANHLFEVTEFCVRLKTSEAELFYHNFSKSLFLCKHARPDIQTTVALLCTWVKSPDQDDYKKLAQTMKCLHHTQLMPLTLEASDMNVVKWWVDASFAGHPNMRSHAGGIMTLVSCGLYAVSTKQKLNTRSSTESELIGLHDVMPLLKRNFQQAQDYENNVRVVGQDNQSAILL